MNKIYQKAHHNSTDLKIHIPILELSNCKDTIYNSTIGNWYIDVYNEPYCIVPHFHIINKELKFDCRIMLFKPIYFGDKYHKYELSKEQKEILNEWMSNKCEFGYTYNWRFLCFIWEECDNKLDNWKNPDEYSKPNYINITYMEE